MVDSHALDDSETTGLVSSLLRETAKELSRFLEPVLSANSPDWWDQCVLPVLGPRQLQCVKRDAVTTLAGLDLAGLLRVLDQNWYAISSARDLSAADRNFAKEMQTVRNRWAHVATDPPERDDTYRDLDTIQRFVTMIGGSAALITRVKSAKRELLMQSMLGPGLGREEGALGHDRPEEVEQPGEVEQPEGPKEDAHLPRPAGVAVNTWPEIKDAIRADLLSRGLKDPRIRLGALDRLERLLPACYPGFLDNPRILCPLSKEEIAATLASLKPTGQLNSAEKSVLGQILALLNQQRSSSVSSGSPRERHIEAVPRASQPTSDANLFKRGLPPIVDGDSRILILGTIPGDESWRLQQYYAHPRNQFCAIIADIYDEHIGGTYEERIFFLKSKGLALWDVLQSARRPGSLDSAMDEETPNDFAEFFDTYPQLRTIGFNGSKASRLFQRYVMATGNTRLADLRSVELPSTSPTPGRNVLR